jgi:DNA-binding NarL/FixJ family response regulator
MRQRKSVLVVDSFPIIRRGLAYVISESEEFEVSGEADSYLTAFEIAEATTPDIVICDLELKDGRGDELVNDIFSSLPSVGILASTSSHEPTEAERIIRLGAHGFLSKEAALDELLTALKCISSQQVYLSPELTRQVLAQLRGIHVSAEPPSSIQGLTRREIQVVTMIGQGMATQQIADVLQLSPRTIHTYRERVKRKLKLENGPALNRFAYELNSTE